MAGEGLSTAVTLGDPAGWKLSPLGEDDLKTLIDALQPMARKYLLFGIQINVKMSEIKIIQIQCADPNECLLEILSLRLTQFPPLTLYDIYTALRSNTVGECLLAEIIWEQYSSIRTQQTRKRKLTQFISDSEEGVKKVAFSETDEASENDTDDSKLLTQERLSKDRDMMETPIKFVSDSEESVKKGALSESDESSKRDTDNSSVEQSEVMIQHSDYGGKLINKQQRKRKKPQTKLLAQESVSKVSGIMETPLKTASKTADSDSNSFKHYRQVKRKKHGNARDSSVAKFDTKWQAKSQSHRKRRESNRKRVKIESSSCSSSECSFSSPEDRKLSELQNKTIIKVFKSFFGRLYYAMEDPLEISVQLQAKFLLSRSELEKLIKSSDSTMSKTLTLVHTLHRKIKSRPNIIFSTVQVLLQNLALKETAQHMLTEIGNNNPFSIFNGIYLFPYP